MALSKREKRLAWVTGLLAAGAAVWFAYNALRGPLTTLRAERNGLRDEVAQKQRQVEAAWKAQKQMVDYRSRSLPSQIEIARSLYKNWLLELTTDVGWEDTRVEPGETRVHRDYYRLLPFSIHARGDLDELTEFLYRFYAKGYIHKIRQLTVKPREGTRALDLSVTIETLSLADADHAEQLPKDAPARLADASLADYDTIVDRNLFAPYRPPSPPVVEREPPREPSPPPQFDPSKYAYITGIVEENGRPQLWLQARTTGETYKLGEGDTFELGPVRGKIVQIHQRAAEVELDGQRRLVALGTSLQSGEVLAN